MRRYLVGLFVLCLSMMSMGCLMLDEEGDRPGYVSCGDEVCQPGTYCSNPRFDICDEGCLSDANCLAHEQCLKEKSSDRTGSCISSKSPPCCE